MEWLEEQIRMDIEHHWQKLRDVIVRRAQADIRQRLEQAILVGPFNDTGVSEPGKEKGEGFAIFIGEWRIGWFETRSEACEAASRLGDAIARHPLR